MLEITMEYVKYLVPMVLMFGVPYFYWQRFGGFMSYEGKPIVISNLTSENLSKYEGEYVRFVDLCFGESSWWYKKDSEEQETIAISNCEKNDYSNTVLWALLDGDKEDNWMKIDSGELDFWSGQLCTGYEMSSYLVSSLRKSRVPFEVERVWTLKVGHTPEKAREFGYSIMIGAPISGLIILFLLIRYDIKNLRERNRKMVIDNPQK